MLRIQNISLVHFKNYREASFSFAEPIIGLAGKNGTGKTNLLDAIYYCCFTKSYFNKSDLQSVTDGEQGFRIEGNFTLRGAAHVLICVLRENGKKEFLLDGEAYDKFSRHIGRFPCVIVAPDDLDLIRGGSEERRKWLDALLSQLDPDYLRHLIGYSRVLLQRNALLRNLGDPRAADASLLEVYDEQLANHGQVLFERRQTLLRNLVPQVEAFYRRIAGVPEPLQLNYRSQLLQSRMNDLLSDHRHRDIAAQRSLAGIHRDDLDIQLQGKSFRQAASQGQRKSLLFALKLSEYETLKSAKGFAPLLLLDDVFEKLDGDRMINLLAWVAAQPEGQIFITDTHSGRIREFLERLSVAHQLIEL